MKIDTSSNKNLHVSSSFLFCIEFDGISLTWRKTGLSISQSSPDAPRDYLWPAIGSWWPQSWVILTVYIYMYKHWVKSEQVLSTYIYPTDNARRQFLYRIFRTYIVDLVTDNNKSVQNLNPECSIQTQTPIKYTMYMQVLFPDSCTMVYVHFFRITWVQFCIFVSM